MLNEQTKERRIMKAINASFIDINRKMQDILLPFIYSNQNYIKYGTI